MFSESGVKGPGFLYTLRQGNTRICAASVRSREICQVTGKPMTGTKRDRVKVGKLKL